MMTTRTFGVIPLPPRSGGERGGVPRPRRTGARMMTVQSLLPFPDAVQRETLRRRAGIVSNAVIGKVPVLRRITQACCTAPGTRAVSS